MSKANDTFNFFEVFDDMNGKFEARLRDHRIIRRTSRMREGDVTVTNPIAILEVKFDFDVLDRLHEPSFIGIERNTFEGKTYLIYEVIASNPIHFQMLGMDVAMPKVIRKEYLTTISQSWGKSDETWIDVVAVPTFYKMDVSEGKIDFKRARIVPLVGSKAYLLSKESVRRFLCVEDGVEVGKLIGFKIPLKVDINSMIKYHTGLFGFTGSGKSNLTSYLIRLAVSSIEDLRVVIFDVAGEYSIHLLDLLLENGKVYSTERFKGDPSNFLNSQAIPETLEEKLDEKILLDKVQRLFDDGKIEELSVEEYVDVSRMTLGFVANALQSASESSGSGRIQATIALQRFANYFFDQKGYDEDKKLSELSEEDREELISILNELIESTHGMSSLRIDMTALVNYVKSLGTIEEESKDSKVNPEILASLILSRDAPRIVVVYVPEPDVARYAVSRFIDRLLLLKKTTGARRKVLVVLDEAQEFIPDRTSRSDYSDLSNRAVEALLRQGRKYRAHCWLSTQRVAHLNVNALQQLHSYFVSTLPRFYDRMVIADAFSLSYDMLEKATELDTGQWIFVSYKATKQKNVPAFVQTPNNEEILISRIFGSE